MHPKKQLILDTHQWLPHLELHLHAWNSYTFLQAAPFLFHKKARVQSKANLMNPKESSKWKALLEIES